MSGEHATMDGADRLVWARPVIEALRVGAEEILSDVPSGTAVMIRDASGVIVGANARAESILGLTLDQLVGRTPMDPRWSAVSEQGLPLLHDQRPGMRTLETGEPIDGFLMGVLIPSTWATRWIQIDSRPIAPTSAGPLGVAIIFTDVSSTGRARAAAGSLFRVYRLLAENTDDVIWTMTLDGSLTYVSPAVERVSGFTPAEMMGRPLDETHPPESFDRIQQYVTGLRAALQSGTELPNFRGDLEYFRKNGTIMVGDVRLIPKMDATGKVVQILGVTRDVTENRASMRELARSRAEFAEAQQIAKAGSWSVDLRNKRGYWSAELYRIVGMTPPAAPQTWLSPEDLWALMGRVLSPATLGQVQSRVAHTLATGESYELEYDVDRPDGQRVRLVTRTTAMHDESGAIVGLRGSVADVTALRTALQAVAEREARFRAIEATARDAIITIRHDGQIVGWNAAAEHMFGYSAADAVGRHVSTVAPTSEYQDLADRLAHEREKRRESSEEPPPLAGIREMTATRRDGSVFPIEVSAASWTFGGELHFTAIVRNITERHARQTALERSRAELAEAQRIAHVGSWTWDPNSDVTTWSAEFCRILGLPADTAGPSIAQAQALYTPESWTRLAPAISRTTTEGVPYKVDVDLIRTDGVIVHAIAQGEAERGPDGAVVMLRGTLADVTQLRETQDALAVSEERFRAALNGSEDSIVMYRPVLAEDETLDDLEVIWANLAARQRWLPGREHDDPRGIQVFAEFGYLRPSVFEVFVTVLATREEKHTLQCYETPTGKRWVDLRISPFPGGLLAIGRDVTEVHRAQNALTASEERFRTIFEAAPIGIALVDALTGAVSEVNEQFAAIAGRTRDQMRTIDWMSFTHPDDIQPDFDNLARLNRHEIPKFELEKRYIRPDGSIVWISQTVVPVTTNDSTRPQNLCLIEDITERKVIRDEVVRSRSELAEAQRIAHVGNWTWDVVTGTARWSDEVYRIYGFEPQVSPLDVASLDSLFPPESQALANEMFNRALVDGQPFEYEHQFIRPDGTRCWGLRHAVPERGPDGRVVAIHGIEMDITERKLAQAEMERAFAELTEAQRVAKVGSWVLDTRHGLATASEETYRIAGLEPPTPAGAWVKVDAFLGSLVPLLDPATVKALAERDAHTLATGEPYELEYDLRRPDGQLIRILARVDAMRDPSGAIVGLRGTSADITESHQAAEELRASEARAQLLVEQLQQADSAKNTFIGTLSHELRNPLAAIVLALDQVQEVVDDHPEARWSLDIAERQSQHLARLVDDLLDVIRMSQNTIVLQTEPVGLNKLIWQIANDNQNFFDECGVSLEVRTSLTPLRLEADPARLTQAIGNLLHNAAKFSYPGVTVTLSIERDHTLNQAVVKVTDHGRGIAPDMLSHIFEAYWQADQGADRALGGLGLGLPIVKQIVELHGGTVTAASAGVGKGAQFTVRLPLIHQMEPKKPESPPTTNSPGPARPLVLRILLIEDDDALRELTALQLTQLGYAVVAAAATGPDGVAAARQHRPDVIVCDIGLPGMDGFSVARAIRAIPDLDTVRLIALSGYGQPEYVNSALEAGFDRHLTKPVNTRTLAAVLTEMLSGPS